MTHYERSTLERLLEAGAAADALTPGYAIVRNALVDGTAVNIRSDVWHQVKPQLAAAGIAYWSEQLWFDGGSYWICVSMAADDLDALNVVLASYGHEAVQDRGRLWQWLAAITLTLLALSVLLLAAVVGGAL